MITAPVMQELRDAGLVGASLGGDDVAAAVLAALLGATALAGYLYLFQPKEASSPTRLLLLALLVVLWALAARLFLAQVLPDNDRLYLAYILPVAAAPMVVASLLDAALAITVAATLAFLATFAGFYQPDARAALGGNPLEAFQMVSVYVLGSLAGIYTIHRAERVNRYLLAGAAAAFVSFTALLMFWLLDAQRELVDLPWMLSTSALGGLVSAVITVGAFVVLGMLFGITTRIQLMELAQLNHPLLRRLQAEAPGTFHHSVVVGNLAERAADTVGADSLLVRVGCYFHDIGKLARPGFYIENQLDGRNPHERLDPYTSAKVVSAHVHAGMELARKHRLPAKVRAIIVEHHGTRLVTYFYRKASQENPEVELEAVRLPGAATSEQGGGHRHAGRLGRGGGAQQPRPLAGAHRRPGGGGDQRAPGRAPAGRLRPDPARPAGHRRGVQGGATGRLSPAAGVPPAHGGGARGAGGPLPPAGAVGPHRRHGAPARDRALGLGGRLPGPPPPGVPRARAESNDGRRQPAGKGGVGAGRRTGVAGHVRQLCYAADRRRRLR